MLTPLKSEFLSIQWICNRMIDERGGGINLGKLDRSAIENDEEFKEEVREMMNELLGIMEKEAE